MSQFRLDEKTKRAMVEVHRGIIKAIREKDKKRAFRRMEKQFLHVHQMHKRLEEGEFK
jgi:hypothetical protein